MRAWWKSTAPYLLSMVLHVVVGGGLALAALFVAREVIAHRPIEVELVVKPRRPPPITEDSAEPGPTAPSAPKRPRVRRPRPRPRLPPPEKAERLAREVLAPRLPRLAEAPAPLEPAEPLDPGLEDLPVREGPAAAPSYGISLDSSAGGGSIGVREGNTIAVRPGNGGPPEGPVGRPPGGPATARAPKPPPPELEITDWPERVDAHVFRYPEAARRAGLEGGVRLRLQIDAQGNVVHAELADDKADPQLAREALANAKSLRFRPARKGPTPVACEIKYTFTFVLD